MSLPNLLRLFKKSTSFKSRARKSNTARPRLELLEDRTLPSAGNVFAQFDGALAKSNSTTQIPINIAQSDFTLNSKFTLHTKTMVLGFELEPGQASKFDPAAVQLRDAKGKLVTPQYSVNNIHGNTSSLALDQLTFGKYTLTIKGQNSTAGAFHLDVFLAGDANNDHTVDQVDQNIIKNKSGAAAGTSKYLLTADANLDGKIDQKDLSFWADNVGNATSVRPLSLSALVSPTPITLPSGSLATGVSAIVLSGLTNPKAVVKLETGGDQLFDEGTNTADKLGQYSFAIKLKAGLNSLQVRAADSFGQQQTRSILLTLTTGGPAITIVSPANGLTTTTNPTISGTVASTASTVASLQARVDGGTAQSVPVVNGKFQFTPPLPLDGTADGSHSVSFVAVDAANQVSAPASVSYILDTQPPVITVTNPSANVVSSQNITVAGSVSDAVSGVASLQASVDSPVGPFTVVTVSSSHFSFSTNLSTDGSADGPHQVYLRATDGAGNVSTLSSLPFNLITIAKQAIPVLDPASDSGASNSDGITNVATPVFHVAAPTGLKVSLLVDGQLAQQVISVDGTATFSPGTLSSGPHSIAAAVQGSQGNFLANSDPLSIQIITAPPAVPSFDLAGGTADLGPEMTSAARVTLIGQTDGGVMLGLVGTSMTALASGNGSFQFPGVNLIPGANPLAIQATDLAGNSSTANLTVTRGVATNGPNAVLVWNQATLNAIQTDGTDPLFASRGLAMVQAAVYDAVNAIEGTPTYYIKATAPSGASVEAAVDQAAHDVLAYLYPSQQKTFDDLLTSQLAKLPANQATTDGQSVGQQVAAGIIALRANDGSRNFFNFVPVPGVGNWQPTPPAYALALDPQWANVTPFAMTGPTQFEPAGPPALTSQQWADAVNLTQSMGAVHSTTRTADQTQTAQFWNDATGTYTPPGHWNSIAQTVAQQQGDSLIDDARLFAELNVALADAGITAWNSKFTYDTWRPITVIQSGGSGVNPGITADPNWYPLLTTPNFPEYVSGHATFSAAAADILDSFFGNNVGFSSTEQTLPGVVRSFTSFDQAAQEAGMSRIYAGIHFIFSTIDGQAAGKNVADWVLKSFNITQDVVPPKVSLDNVLPLGASAKNFLITGQTTDNLSGVARLEVQVDAGAYVSLPFDPATGRFAYFTAFPPDGSADGPHAISFRATDAAGNVSIPATFSLLLDSQAPILSITSPTDGGDLATGTALTGSVQLNGAALVALNYSFDSNPMKMPIIFNTDGSFNQLLDLSKLNAGPHTLTITAQDAAGNVSTQTLNVNLASPIALTVTSLTPADGATDIGLTFRPKVIFSRPIDTTTLTSANFFATDTAGNPLPATIVPSDDGTYAWLFFTNPMPGASMMTLTVDGSTIKAADGSLLDAAGTGTPGSVLHSTFTTVNESFVPGTTLSGVVADPGPDLKPMTRDDVRNGPDGVLGTGDDVYLRPIQGVKVFILGHEDEAVYTDANGYFSFSSVPSGDVKLALVGNTPGVMVFDPDTQQFVDPTSTGCFFPEMVMDLDIKPGVANTVMGTMGSRDEQMANLTNLGVYLPRLCTIMLQPVSDTQPTMITTPPQAAPDLTPQQRQFLTAEVQPNTAIGFDGQKISNPEIGISTVPTSLIKDMLPPGVQQPLFTITVQAPGVATFSTPLTLTFPNVDHAAPGTKLEFMSFDHTTGRLEIEGTATVSADGLYVVSDPDSGLTHPGWHFVAPLAVFKGNVNADQSKAGHNLPALLGSEYGFPWVVPFSDPPELSVDGYLAGQAAFAGSRFKLSNDPVALGFFNDWVNGTTADLDSLNQIAKQEFLKDPNFQNNVVQEDVQQIKKVAAQQADKMKTFTVDLTPRQFAPKTEDLGFSYGRSVQIYSVQGSGDVNSDGTVVTNADLTYTFKVLYGYGSEEAHKRPITDIAGDDFFFLRMMQLAGYATPFVTSVTLTVHIENDQIIGDPPNPPSNPQTNVSTVPGFGSDPRIYYRFDLANGLTIQGKTDASGSIDSILFPALTHYTGTFYQPSINSWTSIVGTSGPSGQPFGLGDAGSAITLDHFGGVDSTGDGLPDIARYVIGLKVGVRSFAGDGIDDATKLEEGLDPLSGIAFPTGVIATLPLAGAQKLAVAGNSIYVATNTGLTIVDAKQFSHPIVEGQINLNSGSSDVGVDSNLQIAAVATGNALQEVDVSNPMAPKLIRSVPVSANRVVVANGLAYAASGTALNEVDLATGEVLQTVNLPGFGTVTGLARDGTMLYAFVSGSDILSTIDISTEAAAAVLGQVEVDVASFDVGVFAANGVVWLAGSGLRTVDVSNPSKPTLIHSADVTFTARRIALNGSGLGVLSPDGNSFIEVYDTSNPNATANRLLQIPLSGGASDVAISRGIAYVADSSGLEVVNYLPFDNKGVPPTAAISTSAPDVDLLTPGLQIFEGSSVPIQANISDDVQVAKVELLVNGQVVQSDVSFPFDFFAIAPSIAQSGNSFTVQVRATDTGGNVGLSNVLTFGLVNDTSPLTLSSLTPASGASLLEGPQTVRIGFSKPVAAAAVTSQNFQLQDSNGNPIVPATLQLRNGDRLVQLTYTGLPAGNYQLVINGTAVTDRNGNPLGAGNVTSSFTLTPRETLSVQNADADSQTPGLQLFEASTVKGTLSVDSSVSVQSVAILLNGQVVTASSAVPFNFSFIAPLLSAGASSFTLQAQVTDTSGFVTTSNLPSVGLLQDTTPPSIVSTRPTNGATAFRGLKTITVTFSEPIVTSTVVAANFQVFEQGSDGNYDVAVPVTAVKTTADDTVVQLTVAPLAAGSYQLQVSNSAVSDRVGNAMGTGTFTSSFQVSNTSGAVLLLVDQDGPGPDALTAALQAAGFDVTERAAPEYTWDATNPSLDGYAVVIHLDGATFSTPLPVVAQQALETFVQNGGGFIGSQWDGYELVQGWQVDMPDLVLQRWFTGGDFDVGQASITYATVPGEESHPVLAGLPSTFTYFADGQDDAALVNFANQPSTVLMTRAGGGPGVIVRDFGTGHVVNFSFAADYITQTTLLDANIQQLYVNAVNWELGGQS